MAINNPEQNHAAACLCGAAAHADHHAHDLSAPDRHARAGLSRRGLLRAGLTGVAAAGLVAGLGPIGALQPGAALAQSALSPDAALQELMDGNGRFVARKLKSFDEDLAILQQNNIGGQQPFASILSCADSRVPVELLFDHSIGHVFVNRVAGNIATTEIIASIEYGVAVLGTRVLMVLGHSSCGAVSASISAGAVPGQISALYRYIRPAVDAAGSDPFAATKANAQIQARLLSESSPVIAGAIKGGTLKVVAAYYDLASGKVALVS
jgi:carbonic anhydrase